MVTGVIVLSLSLTTGAQTCEWRLVNPTYSNVDPDGGGPATGSVTFTMQIHAVSGTIPNITGISTGWSWQSANAMLPTGAPCGTNSISRPGNITMSSAFSAFTYNNANECSGTVNFITSSQTFDRRSAGTIDRGSIDLTTTWVDVFTVTLWTPGTSTPEAGYVVINSGDTGSTGSFGTYAVSDVDANDITVNSLTYTTALALGSSLPVLFSKFDANCTDGGTLVSWSTGSEFNSSYFEVQQSANGNDWTPVASVNVAGNSGTSHSYQQLDPEFGKAFYRIKQVDLDGQFVYTNIISSNCVSKTIDMVLYPVPARDILNVVINSTRAIKTKLAIIDGLGRTVQVMEVSLVGGSNTFQFNLKGLASGEYLIQSNTPGAVLNKKFNIVR